MITESEFLGKPRAETVGDGDTLFILPQQSRVWLVDVAHSNATLKMGRSFHLSSHVGSATLIFNVGSVNRPLLNFDGTTIIASFPPNFVAFVYLLLQVTSGSDQVGSYATSLRPFTETVG